MKNKKNTILQIREIFNEVYSAADCTLDYKSALELLISTQLAAQCTDARVNIVAQSLYKKYTCVQDFAKADILELEQHVRPTGFFHNKAKNIIACCQMLLSDFGGEVPATMDELLRLPGVGRKTANLVLGDHFGIPGIVVDTHATRLSQRIGLTTGTTPEKIERDLLKIVPPDYQNMFCHQLVYHGRAVCTARSPKCTLCPILHLCDQKFSSKPKC